MYLNQQTHIPKSIAGYPFMATYTAQKLGRLSYLPRALVSRQFEHDVALSFVLPTRYKTYLGFARPLP